MSKTIELRALAAGDKFILGERSYEFVTTDKDNKVIAVLNPAAQGHDERVLLDGNSLVNVIPAAIETHSIVKQPSEVKEQLTEVKQLKDFDIEAAFQMARAAEPSPPPRMVLDRMKCLVALQRKWHLVSGNGNAPDNIGVLAKLIPSGLTSQEKYNFLRGSLEEAKIFWLQTFNRSQTKRSLKEAAKAAGIPNALEAFDEPTKGHLINAIRLLPEEQLNTS